MKKILIIEDEAVMNKLLRESFKEDGFEVGYATDGERGLELIKSEKADVILLDIILPKMDGFEILKNLKENKIKTAPIILLTNLSEVADIQKALDLGARTYLLKSDYQLKEIVKKVKDLIDEDGAK